jgi:6-pyruvoyltetrahydropterin/6-carboxytetrahydropterin synthase
MKRFGVRVYKDYFKFASSHFLIFADGAREELHGHNYYARVAVRGEVGEGDLVVDFCKLKPIVRRFCDELDHRLLLPTENPRLALERKDDQLWVRFSRTDGGVDLFVFPVRDVVLLPLSNTSTERLAEHLAGKIIPALASELGGAERLEHLEVEVEEADGQCGVCRVELRPVERPGAR